MWGWVGGSGDRGGWVHVISCVCGGGGVGGAYVHMTFILFV